MGVICDNTTVWYAIKLLDFNPVIKYFFEKVQSHLEVMKKEQEQEQTFDLLSQLETSEKFIT